jgi:hypothetical protein
MKSILKAAAVAAFGVAALTACSSPAAAPQSAATATATATATASPKYEIPERYTIPTPTAAGQKTYSDIDALHEAFVAAGGTCKDFFKPQLKNALPKATGKCGTESGAATMYLLWDSADRDQLVESNRAMAPVAKLPINMVVGDWWVIESPEAAKVAEALGGTLVDKAPPQGGYSSRGVAACVAVTALSHRSPPRAPGLPGRLTPREDN